MDRKGKVEPPWLDENIKREIKRRRRIKREGRGASGERKEELWELYKAQKESEKDGSERER